MRMICAIAAALMLSGCNMVISQTPWFAGSDQSPRLAQGLWVLEQPGCHFEPAVPVSAWPDCAEPLLVHGAAFLTPPHGAEDGGKARDLTAPIDKWESIVPVLAPGDPMILQVRLEAHRQTGAPTPEVFPFIYFAVRPVTRDADGTLRAMRMWSVFCGPPPPQPVTDAPGDGKPPAAASISMISAAPFPGLKAADVGCVAESQAALRGAAARSEFVAAANNAPPFGAHWLRAAL